MDFARKGVVADISQFLVAHKGSVLHSDDHLDSGRNLLLSRLEWDLDGFDIPISDFEHHFKPLAERLQIHYHLALTNYRPKVAILVSAYQHCLSDLLYRHEIGELACDIVVIISNHTTAKRLADFYQIPFHVLTQPKDKRACDRRCSTCSLRTLT
jgi:formyltetrahydrofolate deformylase